MIDGSLFCSDQGYFWLNVIFTIGSRILPYYLISVLFDFLLAMFPDFRASERAMKPMMNIGAPAGEG